MVTIAAQTWTCTGFSIERVEDQESRTVTFNMSGPWTARNMYRSLSPVAFQKLFESPLGSGETQVHYFNLDQVPYMDSSGLGMLVSHYVRCRSKGIAVVVDGASPRVLELLRISHVENILHVGSGCLKRAEA